MIKVPQRASGPSGQQVSALALGSWHTWDRTSFEEVVAVLRTAHDAGVTLFDVGMYGRTVPGHAEQSVKESTDLIFARAMKAAGIRREDVLLAVKGWIPQSDADTVDLISQVDAHLMHQDTDHADFLVLGDLMCQIDDFSVILDQIGTLLDDGKIRHWAVNNWSAGELTAVTNQCIAMALPTLEYAQHKYGFTRRSVAEGVPLRTVCESTGITIQASDTFEGGLIFGTSTSRMIGGNIGETQSHIRQSVRRFQEAAADLGATTAQLAIAFPLTYSHTSSVVVGSRTLEQTRDNLGAFDLLDRQDPEQIRAAVQEFWFDRDVVDPEASWGSRPGDDPATYVVEYR
ncbi:MAG: aldo/keto reductase [Acidimicrobiales bacterium]